MSNSSSIHGDGLTTHDRALLYLQTKYPHSIYREGYFTLKNREVNVIGIQNTHTKYSGMIIEFCGVYFPDKDKMKTFESGTCCIRSTEHLNEIKLSLDDYCKGIKTYSLIVGNLK